MTDPVSGSSNDYYLPDKKTTDKSAQGLADPEAFLKILVAQMKYQNPMQPQDSETFINQLTQMASMEQMYNVSRSMEKMAGEYEISRYFQLIGQQVSMAGEDEIVTGRVGGITFDRGNPYFYLGDTPGGEYFSMEQLISVSRSMDTSALLPYLSLAGREITVKDGDLTVTGTVEKVLLHNDSVLVRIDGTDYNATQIIELHKAAEEPAAVPESEAESAGETEAEPVENTGGDAATGEPEANSQDQLE